MPTPSNHQNMSMPMAPPQGQPANPFPRGFTGQGMAPTQPNSMCPHPDPSSQHMQMQLQFQLQQRQMQSHGFNNCVAPFATSGVPNHARQQPPTPRGNGRDSQVQPNCGPIPNAHMFYQCNNMSNPTPGPGPNTNAHMVLPARPMQNLTPDHAHNNQMVALGIPIPDSTLGTGHSPHFPTQVQSNSLQNPASDPVPTNQMVSLGIPMPNSGLGPGQLPHYHSHFQPNSPQMSNNINMDVAAQQYIMSQQLMAAAAAVMQNPALVQAFACVQGFQNCFTSASGPPLQTNNHQTMSPQGPSSSLQTHTSSSPCSVPPMPPHPPPNAQLSNGICSNKQSSYAQFNKNVGTPEHAQNQAEIPKQQFSSHQIQPATRFTSAPFPSGQRPLLLSNPAFPSPLEQSAQAFAPVPLMGQNYADIHQMAAAHLAGNIPFQVGGPTPLHQDYQQLQQAQHIMQPDKLQTSKGSSNEQDGMIRNSCITSDMQQFQNGACDGGLSPRIGGSRVSPQNGRRAEAGEPYPKWKIESSGFNSSEQADGRAKIRSPLAHFPPNRTFNNGPSRFQKDVAGGTRSHAAALICKNCDRSFTSKLYMEEHFNCHVKCNEENCSFEASGKILKEHKLIHHGKQNLQRAAPLKSKESVLEIQQWRDERKRNYPTEANVKHKAQQMKEKRARGELLDEDSKIRRQRMKEILAKQAELGLQVAEVPSHYISDGPFYQKGHHKSGARLNYDRFGKPKRSDNSAMKIPRIKDLTSPRSVLNHVTSFKMEQPQEEGSAAIPTPEILCPEGISLDLIHEKVDENCKTKDKASQVTIKTEDISLNAGQKPEKCQKLCRFFQRGRCLKGQRCTYLHVRGLNDTHKGTTVVSELPTGTTVASKLPKRKPTLLEKLLSGEIKKEKSHLLQIFRFMVNNSFFTKWPNEPLKFFQWSREASDTDPEQAEGQYLSYLNSTYGIDEGHADLEEVDAAKRAANGEMESSRDDDVETDLDEVDAKEKVAIGEIESRRDDNLEEGEIEEGEIV